MRRGPSEMDTNVVLHAQIGALLGDLTRARQAVSHKKIDERLRARVDFYFLDEIARLETRLLALQKGLETDGGPAGPWEELSEIRAACQPLLRECLAFLQGALVRSAHFNEDICEIADALLTELSVGNVILWPGLTILGEGHFFHPVSGIIRLPFADISIWNLPVLGHEFGHLLAQNLEGFEGMRQRERASAPSHERFLGELFGDFFGIYSIGPALACTYLLLLFEPGNAFTAKGFYPSFADRAHFVLRSLRKINVEAVKIGARPYDVIIDRLDGIWGQCVEGASGSGSSRKGGANISDPVLEKKFDAWVDEFYSLIFAKKRPPEWSLDWVRAQQIAAGLTSGVEVTEIARDDDTLRVVLNAAWLCRLQSWEQGDGRTEQIHNRAFDLCREIILRPRHHG